MSYKTEDLLNIALVGGANSGKTELTDVILAEAKRIAKAGKIQSQDTVSDFDPHEQSAQHSLKPSFCTFECNERLINLIDTPGFSDFIGRTISVLPAVESVALVLDASASIDTTIQRLFNLVGVRGLCRMIVVNKIDAEGLDLSACVDQIQQVFGKECLPINLPSANRDGVVDCFFNTDEGETDFSSVAEAHENIIDQVVEVDEELMELYLEEGGDLPADRLHEAFEKALREGHLVPICFTSVEKGVGVSDLLEIITKLMPNPREGNPPPFEVISSDGSQPAALEASTEGNTVAHVFGVSIDPFKGRMALCRVHQGTMRTGSQVFIDEERKPIKVSHILRLLGGEQTEVGEVIAGEVCAIPRAEGVSVNSVLHSSHEEDNLRLKPIDLPIPVYGLAIRTKNDTDAQRIADALHTISAEDPSVLVEQVASVNETVVRGMGEIHLRVIFEEIKDKYDVEVDTDVPSIVYKETITSSAEGHHRHKKQTGGAGQFGEVYLRIEPLERGAGFEFIDNIVGGVIPGQFIPAVEKGIQQVLNEGAISGHQMQDIRVSVYDGKHHPVDSKEIAFVQAGKKAFLNAVQSARPIIMEPIVDVNINVPNQCMGDVAGDLSSMGGMVNGSNVQPDSSVEIQGQAPLRELQTYHSRLNSISGGKGSYSMQFSHYAAVQPLLQKQLTDAFHPVEDE